MHSYRGMALYNKGRVLTLTDPNCHPTQRFMVQQQCAHTTEIHYTTHTLLMAIYYIDIERELQIPVMGTARYLNSYQDQEEDFFFFFNKPSHKISWMPVHICRFVIFCYLVNECKFVNAE